MFCVNCGTKLAEEDRFCGICGEKVYIPNYQNEDSNIEIQKKNEGEKVEIVYIDEKPMKSILDNATVITLTLFFFVLSLITIISISAITKDFPSSNQLEGISSYKLY